MLQRIWENFTPETCPPVYPEKFKSHFSAITATWKVFRAWNWVKSHCFQSHQILGEMTFHFGQENEFCISQGDTFGCGRHMHKSSALNFFQIMCTKKLLKSIHFWLVILKITGWRFWTTVNKMLITAINNSSSAVLKQKQ